jgi:FkbM family methyltransferase
MDVYQALNCSNTKSMFVFLLRLLRPNVILDVGSRDGSDALRFRRYAPGARIIAIEANPELHGRMEANPELRRAKIETKNAAASDKAGTASFAIFNEHKGTGSLRQKIGAQAHESYVVPTVRLDSMIQGVPGPTALWIDVEGLSYEVIQGASGILSSVVLVHAEMEAQELFAGQRTSQELTMLLEQKGFTLVDGGVPPGRRAGNAIFVPTAVARRLSVLIPVVAYKGYSRVRDRRRRKA